MDNSAPFDTIIVGAGLSGLVAASRLREQGHRICVIEARDHVGGRIQSVPLSDDQALDLGAQWISDRQPNITALVKKLKIAVHPTWRSGDKLFCHGMTIRRVGMDHTPLSWLQVVEALTLRLSMQRLMRGAVPKPDDPLDRRTVAEFLRASCWSGRTCDYLAGVIGADLCLDTRKISMRELLNQVQSIGGLSAVGDAEQHIITGGAAQITDYLAEQVRDTIVLRRPVLVVRQNCGRIEVETDGRTFVSRTVILAVPPQCLANIRFPSVSPLVLRQWERFRRGAVVKTSAVFEEPFWRGRGLSGTMEGCDAMFPLIVDSGPPQDGAGVLTALSTAESARRAGALSETDRGQHYLSLLKGLLGPEIPPVQTIRSVDWSHEEFVLGGYASRRAPGGWSQAPDLFASVGKIHFAGTETAELWRSYMEGAIVAGRRAAAKVASSLA